MNEKNNGSWLARIVVAALKIIFIVQVDLVILKLAGLLDESWVMVLLPFIFVVAAFFVMFIGVALFSLGDEI